MFNRVIVATDLSPAAFSVVKNLNVLREFKTEHCLILQCLSMTQAGSAGLYYTYNFFEQGLEDQKKIVEQQGYTAEARLIPGVAKSEISRIAQEEDYQLVVAGATPSSLMSAALMGGIGYELIHGMKNPILLMRLAEKKTADDTVLEPMRPDYLRHILFPSDFSSASNRAFEIVKKLAIAGAQKITLMHVQDRAKLEPYLINRLDEFNEIDEARLQAMKELLHEVSDIEVDIVLAFGNPSKEILTTVQERDVQLVVMGSQGRGFMGDLFLGSVSHNVARHAAASVLLIPPPPII
jgi:nucleotide-binding universal stress UspA family protein